jgi:hypothetical protein
MFLSKTMGTDTNICIYSIPYRFKKKYADSFSELKQRGLITEFEMTEFYWMRYPPFRSELYNFETKSWNVDWKKIEAPTQEAGVTSFSVNHDPKVDDVDIKILKHLKEDPTCGIAKVGNDIGVNPRTVRYHHTEHVIKGHLISGNNIRWTWPLQQGRSGEIMQVMVEFKGLQQDELPVVRKLFNKLPFTWVEGGTQERDYFAFLDIPILSFHDCVRFIELNLRELKSKFTMSILDSSKTQYLNVPDEMFDKRLGWRLFGVSDELVRQREQEEQNRPGGTSDDEPRESRQIVDSESEGPP